jgi:hypothetical protein
MFLDLGKFSVPSFWYNADVLSHVTTGAVGGECVVKCWTSERKWQQAEGSYAIRNVIIPKLWTGWSNQAERLVGECRMHAEMRDCSKISVMTPEGISLITMGVDGPGLLPWRWYSFHTLVTTDQTARRHSPEDCNINPLKTKRICFI